MDNLEVKFYDAVNDELLKFAVIISQSNGKWVVVPDGMIFSKDEIRQRVHF